MYIWLGEIHNIPIIREESECDYDYDYNYDYDYDDIIMEDGDYEDNGWLWLW